MKRALALTAAALLLALASLAGAETIQKGSVRIAFDGKITPQNLPREGAAPAAGRRPLRRHGLRTPAASGPCRRCRRSRWPS